MGLGRCEATGLQPAGAARQGELLDLGKKVCSEAGLGGEARLAGQINLDRFKCWSVNVKDPLLKTVLFFFGGSISMKLTKETLTEFQATPAGFENSYEIRTNSVKVR